MEENRIEIDLSAGGLGKVILNGNDISSAVEGIKAEFHAGRASSVIVYLTPMRARVYANAEIELRQQIETETGDGQRD